MGLVNLLLSERVGNCAWGVASLYIFMEFGIGVGAFLSGLIYGDESSMIFVTFLISSILSGMAFLYLLWLRRSTVEPVLAHG